METDCTLVEVGQSRRLCSVLPHPQDGMAEAWTELFEADEALEGNANPEELPMHTVRVWVQAGLGCRQGAGRARVP